MSYLELVTDIKNNLNAIASIGVVHTYERQIVDPAKFIELFRYRPTGQILGWEMHRTAVPETIYGAHHRLHQFRLSGYMSLDDAKASSITFQDLCDKVCARFRTAANIAGLAAEYRNAANPENAAAQIDIINDRTFGAVLCHCAEISLVISERIII